MTQSNIQMIGARIRELMSEVSATVNDVTAKRATKQQTFQLVGTKLAQIDNLIKEMKKTPFYLMNKKEVDNLEHATLLFVAHYLKVIEKDIVEHPENEYLSDYITPEYITETFVKGPNR